MAGHRLIDAYLAELGGRLPARAVEELADGLIETWEHHLRSGLDRDRAAEAAIAEFGTVEQVNDAFVSDARGRRVARPLLATAPLFAACWGTGLVAARAWTWPVPRTAAVLFAIALVAVASCLVLAATSRHDYRRTRLGTGGALGVIALDATMLGAVVAIAPVFVWPMALAIPASVLRMGLAARSLRPLRA